MKNWKITKNTMTETPCWQIYYDTEAGKHYYNNHVFTYCEAKAVAECLSDPEIREAVTIAHHKLLNPWDGMMETRKKMRSILKNNNVDATFGAEWYIYDILKEEEEK